MLCSHVPFFADDHRQLFCFYCYVTCHQFLWFTSNVVVFRSLNHVISVSPCTRGFHDSAYVSDTRCISLQCKIFHLIPPKSFIFLRQSMFITKLHKHHVSFAFPLTQFCFYLKYQSEISSQLLCIMLLKCVATLCSYVSDVSYTKMAFEFDNVLVMSTHSFPVVSSTTNLSSEHFPNLSVKRFKFGAEK